MHCFVGRNLEITKKGRFKYMAKYHTIPSSGGCLTLVVN